MTYPTVLFGCVFYQFNKIFVLIIQSLPLVHEFNLLISIMVVHYILLCIVEAIK